MLPFEVRAHTQELRREIAEILAADHHKYYSGAEKVKHEGRIERICQIRNELFALIKPCTTRATIAESQRE